MAKKRKSLFDDQTKADDMDALAKILRDTPGDKLRAILKRDIAFTFRLSRMDRETMEKAAKALEIPTSEYLIRLHWFAYEQLKDAGVVE